MIDGQAPAIRMDFTHVGHMGTLPVRENEGGLQAQESDNITHVRVHRGPTEFLLTVSSMTEPAVGHQMWKCKMADKAG